MNSFLILSAGVALTTAATASAAADPAEPVDVVAQRAVQDQLSERVAFNDLDLADLSGRKVLTRRVRAAVGKVCAPYAGDGDRTLHGECRADAWAGARPQMAQAVTRAQQLAATGTTTLPKVAISVVGVSVR